MSDRAFAIHYARVLLAEASRRRHSSANRNYYWTLISNAQKARRDAAAISEQPAQLGLFA